jgi:hypothetical protein
MTARAAADARGNQGLQCQMQGRCRVGRKSAGEVGEAAEVSVETNETRQRVTYSLISRSNVDRHGDRSYLAQGAFALLHHQPIGRFTRPHMFSVKELIAEVCNVGEPWVRATAIRSLQKAQHSRIGFRRRVDGFRHPFLESAKCINFSGRVDTPARKLRQIVAGAGHFGQGRMESKMQVQHRTVLEPAPDPLAPLKRRHELFMILVRGIAQPYACCLQAERKIP